MLSLYGHHVVADAPLSDEAVLDRCLDFLIPAMLRRDPVRERSALSDKKSHTASANSPQSTEGCMPPPA
jgi:hypothetical protein